jgi:hypothetical protein
MALIESSFDTQTHRLVVRVDGDVVPAHAAAFSEADADGVFDCSVLTPSWQLSTAGSRQAAEGQSAASVAYPGLLTVQRKPEQVEVTAEAPADLVSSIDAFYPQGLR